LQAGKLDQLIAEARKEFKEGRCRQIWNTSQHLNFGSATINCLEKYKS
jgi:hypothetical protein